MERLGTLGGFANHVSMALTGLPTSTSGKLASMVFAKSCAHARSIGAIAIQSSMFDHHAIMALARMIMEASTMIAYLLDPVSDDEWTFRYSGLRLHDTVGRLKLMRGFAKPADDLRKGRDELKAQLQASPFKSLYEERKKRLVSGEEMFAFGMRSVATRIMGWDGPPPARVIDIDDFAWCRGHSYGSIVVDLERRQVIDLLPDRQHETVVAWLQKNPQFEIVCRARGPSYGAAATAAAPQERQVADRWHLFENASAAFLAAVRSEMPSLRRALAPTGPVDPAP